MRRRKRGIETNSEIVFWNQAPNEPSCPSYGFSQRTFPSFFCPLFGRTGIAKNVNVEWLSLSQDPFALLRRWPSFLRVRHHRHVTAARVSPLLPTLYTFWGLFHDIEICWSQNCEGHWMQKRNLLCKPNKSRMRKDINL